MSKVQLRQVATTKAVHVPLILLGILLGVASKVKAKLFPRLGISLHAMDPSKVAVLASTHCPSTSMLRINAFLFLVFAEPVAGRLRIWSDIDGSRFCSKLDFEQS